MKAHSHAAFFQGRMGTDGSELPGSEFPPFTNYRVALGKSLPRRELLSLWGRSQGRL